VQRAPADAIRGGSPADNARILESIFAGEVGPRRDIVVINASAALVAAGIAGGFLEGADLASRMLSSGAARDKLFQFRKFMNGLS